MSLKKATCMALSLCMITGGGIISKSSVNAHPTRAIVRNFELEGFSEYERVAKIFHRTKYFINKEHQNTKFYDFSPRRLDSLAFCYFCYLAMMEDNEEINSLVNRAVGMRDDIENAEDINVIDSIFPTNADEFARRFGISLNETVRLEVSKRIHQWRPDTKTVSPLARCRRSRSERPFVRKPSRELLEKFRDGLREYCDMIDSDMYMFYSDSDSDTDSSDVE